MRVVVGISGGSGSIYALGLLRALKDLGVETHLVVSTLGNYVTEHECDVSLNELKTFADYYHENADLAAPIASGSFLTDAMVIVPCSMKTVAAVANGLSDNLLTRAADVTIKENRKLIMVPRETPMSAIHLENMLKLSKIGVTILPASPPFYNMPESISDIVVSIVARILDQIGVKHDLIKRWGE
ncbi:MAG: UbiX family flavin prenyltransferase [Andreesenia angusta]|nr:UbiX family flavin prenyltransferase [Andreesenia angusta]